MDKLLKSITNKERTYFDIDESLKLKWSIELLEGLAYAHSKKIIHRDLKPGNIFLFTQDTAATTTKEFDEDSMINFSVKIGDFGFSKEMLDSCLKSQLGSLHYQSPQAINNRAYTFKTDVW